MRKEIGFYKMAASGNDFILIDNRKKVLGEASSFAREVSSRHTGIGADGVLLLEPSKKGDYRVRILNADGSEAEACGNGFRCVALWAHEKLGFPKKQHFETLAGTVEAEIRKGNVRVQLPDPVGFRNHETLEVLGRKLHYSFIRTGVPHTVIFVEGLSNVPVFELGREIRLHPHFQPAGTNVNFVEVTGAQSIAVRTYERGVENETFSCGTGVSASAIVSALKKYTKPPVDVKTKGGEVLKVDFKKEGKQIRALSLEGETRFVFEGKWKIE